MAATSLKLNKLEAKINKLIEIGTPEVVNEILRLAAEVQRTNWATHSTAGAARMVVKKAVEASTRIQEKEENP